MMRRGTAQYYLKEWKQAKKDFSRVAELEPSNKNALKYLSQTEERLNKIKIDAYQNIVFYADIEGESTGIGKGVIRVEELNIDPAAPSPQEKVTPQVVEKESEEKQGREIPSKVESMISGIGQTKGVQKTRDAEDFVEADEEEELRKLEEERRKEKKNKKKKKGKKKKDKKEKESFEDPQTEETVEKDEPKVMEITEEEARELESGSGELCGDTKEEPDSPEKA